MAQVKGTLIEAWRSFLKDRYGEEKVASAVQSLDADDRLHLLSPTRDSSWYSMEVQEAMGRLTKTLATPADKDLASELGRYTADYVFTKIYPTVIDQNSGKKKAFGWFDYVLFQDLRKCVSESTGPASSVTRYYYLEGKPTPGQCRSLKAFLIRMSELRGRQNVTCIHRKCSSKGDDCCEFLMEWEN